MVRTFSVPKAIVTGIVAGLLGAAVACAFLALVRPGFAGSTSYTVLGQWLLLGAAGGITFALAYPRLPGGYWIKVLIAALVTTAAAWVVIFPAQEITFTATVAAQSVAANAVWGVVAMFVLRQALELALPPWRPQRRAEEFSDNPGGAQA